MREPRHQTTARTVGRLSHPAAEREPGAADEVQKLRHRIRAILRVQQGVGQRRLLPEVRSLAQQARQRMCGRQRRETDDEIPDLVIGGTDADTAAELLQHVDAGPPVRGIHHQMHRAVRVEHVAQTPEGRLRVGEMVQNARAHDLVEGQTQLADALDRQLVDLEIGQAVLAPEILRVPHARRTEVDPDHPDRRTARGVLRRLRGSAAGDEDCPLFGVRLVRPEQMKVRPASVRVLPPPPVVVEIVGRPRIRIPFVEVPDRCRHVIAGNRFRLPAVACWCTKRLLSGYLPLLLAAVSFSST